MPAAGERLPQVRAAGVRKPRREMLWASGEDNGTIVAPANQGSAPCSPRLTLDAGYDTGYQPTRLAHLDHGDQCCILFESYEGSTQIVPLWQSDTITLRSRSWAFSAGRHFPSKVLQTPRERRHISK